MQGFNGDNETEKPSYMDLTQRLKWNAWDDLKGKMTKHEARELFLEEAIKLMHKHGISEEHPDEE